MAEASCHTCGQPRKVCQCPPPALPDTLGLAGLAQHARVLERSQAVEDACRLLCTCASLPTELPPLVQTAVEEALATIRHHLLPPPQFSKVPRGRRPDFQSYEAFLAALDDGLTRFPRRKTLTKARFASYVRVRTPAGEEHGLSARALDYYLELYRVDWKTLKGTDKGLRKKSRH